MAGVIFVDCDTFLPVPLVFRKVEVRKNKRIIKASCWRI